jgi:hypothetical protein
MNGRGSDNNNNLCHRQDLYHVHSCLLAVFETATAAKAIFAARIMDSRINGFPITSVDVS